VFGSCASARHLVNLINYCYITAALLLTTFSYDFSELVRLWTFCTALLTDDWCCFIIYLRMLLPELYTLPHPNFFKFHVPTSGLARAHFVYLLPLWNSLPASQRSFLWISNNFPPKMPWNILFSIWPFMCWCAIKKLLTRSLISNLYSVVTLATPVPQRFSFWFLALYKLIYLLTCNVLCLQQCDGDYYQVDVLMTTTQFQYLKDYVDQKQNSTAEVHYILSSMLHNFRLAAVFLVSALVEPYLTAMGVICHVGSHLLPAIRHRWTQPSISHG